MRRGHVRFRSEEHRRETARLLDLESVHVMFDELNQRSSNSNASPPNGSSALSQPAPIFSSDSPAILCYSGQAPVKSKEMFTRDDTFVTKAKYSFYSDGLLAPRKPQISDSTHQAKKVVTCHEMFQLLDRI